MAFAGINHVLPEELFKASSVVKFIFIQKIPESCRRSAQNHQSRILKKSNCLFFDYGHNLVPVKIDTFHLIIL